MSKHMQLAPVRTRCPAADRHAAGPSHLRGLVLRALRCAVNTRVNILTGTLSHREEKDPDCMARAHRTSWGGML